MTRNSIDVSSHVSPRLSALLKSRVDNPECEQPVTLMAVRRFLVDLLPADFNEAERLHHFDISESPLDELDALMEKLQANWDIGLNGITVEAPRKNIEAAFDLLLSVWAAPSLPQTEFERIKASMVAGDEAALKDPAAMAANIVALRLDNYPDRHPKKALSIAQDIAAYRRITHDQVRACQSDFGGIAHVRLSLVGRFAVEDVSAAWEKIARLPAATVPYERIKDQAAPGEVSTAPVVVALPGKPNASIAGQALLQTTDEAEDFAALRIAVNILGGNSDSRLWNRLRETDGMAYSVGATLAGSSFEPRTQFAIHASAASDKAEAALASLREELARALKEGFSTEEVERAKKAWAQDRRRYASDERLLAARLAQTMLHGRDFVWLAKYDENIAKLNAAEVTAALRKHLGSAPIVWSIGKGSAG